MKVVRSGDGRAPRREGGAGALAPRGMRAYLFKRMSGCTRTPACRTVMILLVNPRATRPPNRRFPLSLMALGGSLPVALSKAAAGALLSIGSATL